MIKKEAGNSVCENTSVEMIQTYIAREGWWIGGGGGGG